VVHDHEGILGGLAAAFSVGCRSLRRAEDFFADLGLGARRVLGLARESPCATTLYRLLAGQSPAGLEETVLAQVKNLIARTAVRNDRLALGVMSFDGKGVTSRPARTGSPSPGLARWRRSVTRSSSPRRRIIARQSKPSPDSPARGPPLLHCAQTA